MPNPVTNAQQLLDKIRRLPPEKAKEVEDFVDFLSRPERSEENAFMRAVVQGLADIEAGRAVGLLEAKKRLGLA
jgi:hypothetical protein